MVNTASATNLANLKLYWRNDAIAGFLVFLIALPLSLGIAIASGFPPMAGIISAIVGGLVVSRLNGSTLTITGPAAGLIVVILAATEALGDGDPLAGYRHTLGAIVIAGITQMVLGFYRAGRLAAFFPASVVHGMLAAIGIIIVTKQLPVTVGVHIANADLLASIAKLPHALGFYSPTVGLVAVIGIAILVGWPLVRHPTLRKIPAPIMVIASGMLLGELLGIRDLPAEALFKTPDDLVLGGALLVSIPDSLSASFVAPDFSKVTSFAFWNSVFAICLVGSLETLLSAAAVDKLDPEKRYSDLNRELRAIGIGNIISGMLGGLPMITEIVRSSANIDNGAKSGWSNFFHGSFLLVFVVVFPFLINLIPLASLAVLLVYTGARLASPQAFAKTLDLGAEQLAIFLVTIVAILATNLLAGVLIGIAAKLLIHLARGVPLNNLLSISYKIEHSQTNTYRISISGSAIFSNFISLKSELSTLPEAKTLIFDLSDAYLIDHTVMDFIDRFRVDYTARGGRCDIHGLNQHQAYANHELAARKRKQSGATRPKTF